MGIAIAVIVYALLRYWGLPGWGASLAALPTLFDAREIALESYILPDTVFCLVVLVTVALLLTRRTPRPVAVRRGRPADGLRQHPARQRHPAGRDRGRLHADPAGGLAGPGRGRRGVRGPGGRLRAGLPRPVRDLQPDHQRRPVPVVAHHQLRQLRHHQAAAPTCGRCARTGRSPSASRPRPAWSVSRLLSEPTPADYLWAGDAWWRTDAHPGINPANNKLGERFAIDAITAQPLDYLRVVGRDVLLTFVATDRPQGGAYMTLHRAAAHPRAALVLPRRHPGLRRHRPSNTPRRLPVRVLRVPLPAAGRSSPACCSCSCCWPGWPAWSGPGAAGAAWPPCPGPWPRSAS